MTSLFPVETKRGWRVFRWKSGGYREKELFLEEQREQFATQYRKHEKPFRNVNCKKKSVWELVTGVWWQKIQTSAHDLSRLRESGNHWHSLFASVVPQQYILRPDNPKKKRTCMAILKLTFHPLALNQSSFHPIAHTNIHWAFCRSPPRKKMLFAKLLTSKGPIKPFPFAQEFVTSFDKHKPEGKRIPTSTLWPPSAVWFYHVSGHPTDRLWTMT